MRLSFHYIVFAALSIGVAGRLVWQRNATNLPPEHILSVDAKSTDFGMAWENHSFPWTVQLRNTTAQTIQLTGVIPSCTCTSAALSAMNVPPYGQVDLVLSINLKQPIVDQQQPVDEQPLRPQVTDFSTDVQVIIANESRPLNLTVRGRVAPSPLANLPVAIPLGEWLPESVPPTVTRHFSMDPRIETLSVTTVDPQLAEANVEIVDGQVTLAITPHGTLPPGDCHFAVDLEAKMRDSLPIVRRRIWCQGRITPLVDLDSSFLLVGAIPVGHQQRESITIRSNSATKFRIERVEASLASTTVMHSASEWTGECLAEVLIRPTVTGQYRGTIRFHLRTEDNEQPLELTSEVQFVGVSTAEEQ